MMTETEMIETMDELRRVLTAHGADVADLLTVADRLLVSAFGNLHDNHPAFRSEPTVTLTLQRIRHHILTRCQALPPQPEA